MFEPISELLGRLGSYRLWEVAIELAVIWGVVWVVWRFVQGTRAAGALKGVVLLVLATLALRLVTPSGSLQRLAFLYDNLLGFAALAVVIIFQPELRRALIRLGEAPIFSGQVTEVPKVVEALVTASTFLSKNSFGAIVAIERQVGLRETIEGGRPINGDVSAELLQTIFWPNSPLHDMGVVIRGSKVVAAGVPFPLADGDDMPDQRLGTRHRAAVGLTRVSDALVLVVSEETGAISLVERGKLERLLTPEALTAELSRRLMATPTASVVANEGDSIDELPAEEAGEESARKASAAEEAAA